VFRFLARLRRHICYRPPVMKTCTNKCRLPSYIARLYACDLDRLPFSRTNDAYAPFTALGTFALAQGAALTAVAKGEGRDTLVLVIYGITVALTGAWIVSTLRSVRSESSADSPNQVARAYDRPSISYGRWTLSWTILLACILLVLGWLQLLPNQTTRIAYDRGDIACDAENAQQRLKLAAGTQAAMDKWVEWIGNTPRVADGEQFFWIEQKSPFPDSYKPFAIDLVCNKDYVFGERVAFLVKTIPGEYRPSYRQVPFRGPGFREACNATLDVLDATRGESLVILLFARAPGSAKQPTGPQFGFKLVPHFSQN